MQNRNDASENLRAGDPWHWQGEFHEPASGNCKCGAHWLVAGKWIPMEDNPGDLPVPSCRCLGDRDRSAHHDYMESLERNHWPAARLAQ